MKLISLQLKTQQIEKAIAFYTTFLGMQLVKTLEDDSKSIHTFQFPNSNTQLELLRNKKRNVLENYHEERTDNYWKYSLFVEDIQHTHRVFKQQQIATNEPYQFGNIGYLMHTKDSENYQIEFIQKTFKQEAAGNSNLASAPTFLESPTFGLITIRTKDPIKSIRFYESFLGMKLLVRMYVDRGNGFTLYFLGKNDLVPLNPNIDAVENREWMYQQKETFIELQHYWGSEYQKEFELSAKIDNAMGFRGIKFSTKNLEEVKRTFKKYQLEYATHFNELEKQEEIQVISPDNQLIIVSS